MNDKLIVKLLEHYDLYKERLCRPDVKAYFITVVANIKKIASKEQRQSVEEFEAKVMQDENAQIALKENNQYAQQKVQKKKPKKGLKQTRDEFENQNREL